MEECNGYYCQLAQDQARKLRAIGNNAGAEWIIRAAHERYCLNHAAGIVATTCRECSGVIVGHAAGTQTMPAQRDDEGRYVKGSRLRWKDCTCAGGDYLNYSDLVELHGLTGALQQRTQSATGTPRD